MCNPTAPCSLWARQSTREHSFRTCTTRKAHADGARPGRPAGPRKAATGSARRQAPARSPQRVSKLCRGLMAGFTLAWLLFSSLVGAQELCDRPQPAASAACAASVDVAIVFDASMKSAADDAAMDSLLHTIVNSYALDSGGPRLALVSFANSATLLQPLTHSSVALSTAIDSRDASAGNTCSACVAAIQQLAL